MRGVARIAEAGPAIVIVRHGRKAGGEIGDSARGSSAWGGAADILLSLRRPPGQGHDNRRNLQAVGRFDDIPASIIIELTEGRYEVLGEAGAIEAQTVRKALFDFMPTDQQDALIEREILERLDRRGIGNRSTLKRAWQDLEEEGLADRDKGFGERGNAYGYWLIDREEPSSCPPPRSNCPSVHPKPGSTEPATRFGCRDTQTGAPLKLG